jgi:SAM-dependent methyltransferase
VLPPLTVSGWLRYDLVRRWLQSRSISSVLEIGPGMGALGVRLALRYEYVGVELDGKSARIAAERLAQIGRGRVVVGTPDVLVERFDLVCAFEVLEHIEDDAAALRDWRERIRPGGWLALSVPGWQHRWGAHDVRAGHYRRYERDQMLALLSDAGFVAGHVLSYGFPLLTSFHPLWNALSARAEKEASLEARTQASGRFRQPPAWLGHATRLVAAPFAILQRPFVDSQLGTGLVALAQRDD